MRLSGPSCGPHSHSARVGIGICRFAAAAIASCVVTLLVSCHQPADTTPPTVTILYPQNGATIQPGPLTIKALATDDRALAQVEFRINYEMLGLDWTPVGDTFTMDWTVPDSLAGCFIKATAVDQEFNAATAMVSVRVQR
jgi:hypothetical protein